MTTASHYRRRVLLVSHYYPPHVGGVENVVRQQALHLARQGVDVTVLTSGERTRTWHDEGVRIKEVAAWNGAERRTGVPFPLVSFALLGEMLRRARWADVVHVHDCLYITSWVAWLGCVVTGTPLVLTQHVSVVQHPSRLVHSIQRFVYLVIGSALLRRAVHVMVVNADVGDFAATHGARRFAVRHLANGVDTALFRPAASPQERALLRERHGLPVDRPLVLFVGRLVPKKGYDLLLRARDPAYDLVFVGHGTVGDGIGERGVHHLGALPPDQVAEIFRACDVFALPSTAEGFPLAVQEAMASGLPVVTTDDPGYAPYNLDRGRVSLLPREPEAFRSELCALVKDGPRRELMGGYSRAYAERGFGWPQHARALLGLYEQVRALRPGEPQPPYPGVRMKTVVRSLLEVAQVHGLLGWIYVAAWAAFRPQTLSGPLTSWLPLRRDTFGAICFAASAVAFLVLQVSKRPGWQRSLSGPGRPLDALLRTLVLYPLLVWCYLCVNSLTHPETVNQRLTHFASFPTEGTAAVGCFAVAAVSLLILRVRAQADDG